MSAETSLEEAFCNNLIEHKLFHKAVKLVKESYKLEVDADQSKKKFKIKANGVELLELVEKLLESWFQIMKKKKGNSIDDRIKATKENPLLDISDGHVVWVFWDNMASELLSAVAFAKVEEKLKDASVDIKPDKKTQKLYITCEFEAFKDVKKKVENLNTLVTSSQAGSDKSQKSNSKNSSQIDDSKSKGSKDGKKVETKGNDGKETSHSESTAGGDNSDKQEKSESSAAKPENLKPNDSSQSKGASGGRNLSPPLKGSDSGSDQSSHSSGSEDESVDDDKLLFRTPYGRTKVFVYEASIVNLSGIEAIVNAANDRLCHGGGVAYHISKAAGGDKSTLEKECQSYIEQNGKIAVTKNFTSSAGNMPYDGVIHAVGPMWKDYKVKEDCANDLCMTIINVLVEADQRKFSKIALPAISSGIFGVPKKMCAEMYIKGVIDYDGHHQTKVREIHFVDISKDILQEIRDAYERWKQNNKSPDNSTSGSAQQVGKTVHPTSVPSGNPLASQHSSNSYKISTFPLSEKTCVKVYVCSIVDVKDVDAVACEVDTDFSIKRRADAQAIREAGGSSYEDEFKKMVSKAKSGSKGDVFICKTGGSLKINNIDHIIHIKCEKVKSLEDMDKLKHLYVQVFECAKEEKMEKIVMPLIGAASLQDASKDVTYKCSQLFAKTLKEVVLSRGKEMNVKEIHLVDLNENLIIFICKAFQELNTANTDDRQAKGETKTEPVSKSKSDDQKKDSPQPKSGVGEGWLKVENGSKNCSYPGCKRKGTKKCSYCGDFLCDLCSPGNLSSQCPFCKKKFDLKTV